MKEYVLGEDLVYMSEEIFDQRYSYKGRAKSEGDLLARERLRVETDKYKELISIVGEFSLPKSMAVLYAHGSGLTGDYLYSDENDFANLKIQDWVNEFDGKFDALGILSCNEGHARIFSRKSKLIYPNRFIFHDDVKMSIEKDYLRIWNFYNPEKRIRIIPKEIIDSVVSNVSFYYRMPLPNI